MADTVELHGKPVPTKDDLEFVTDLARFAEALVSEKDIKRKYRFGNEVWDKLGNDDELLRAVEAEKLRRIRSGELKRERAQQLVTKAPGVLGDILMDAGQSARHRIDSAKVLNDFAANGPQGAPAADRFQITIVLNSDVERYDKSIAVDANDIDPHHPEDALNGPWPVITANQRKDDDGESI